jgi:hypothetical protein
MLLFANISFRKKEFSNKKYIFLTKFMFEKFFPKNRDEAP